MTRTPTVTHTPTVTRTPGRSIFSSHLVAFCFCNLLALEILSLRTAPLCPHNTGMGLLPCCRRCQPSLNRLYHQGGTIPSLSDNTWAAQPSTDKEGTLNFCPSDWLQLPSLFPNIRRVFLRRSTTPPASLPKAIKNISLPPDLCPIIAPMKNGSTLAVSDGSFKEKFGTSAFTIVNAHACYILGLNIVPGHPDDRGPTIVSLLDPSLSFSK